MVTTALVGLEQFARLVALDKVMESVRLGAADVIVDNLDGHVRGGLAGRKVDCSVGGKITYSSDGCAVGRAKAGRFDRPGWLSRSIQSERAPPRPGIR